MAACVIFHAVQLVGRPLPCLAMVKHNTIQTWESGHIVSPFLKEIF
jgi:hypothetical protein